MVRTQITDEDGVSLGYLPKQGGWRCAGPTSLGAVLKQENAEAIE